MIKLKQKNKINANKNSLFLLTFDTHEIDNQFFATSETKVLNIINNNKNKLKSLKIFDDTLYKFIELEKKTILNFYDYLNSVKLK